MAKLYPTYEIGSMAKPTWRTKGFAGRELNAEDLAYAEKWAKILDLDYPALEKVLKGNDPDRKQQIVDWSAIYILKMRPNQIFMILKI